MPDGSASGSKLPVPPERTPAPAGAGQVEQRSVVRVLPWWAYTLAAAVAAALTGVAIWWLLDEAGGDTRLQIEAIRTALTVGLGAGGAFALVINARRQWLQEQAHLHAERTEAIRQAHQKLLHAHQAAVDAASQAHQERLAEDAEWDATERRVTELYNAAADQLGSDKAPVRLTALYTLERLAGDNPDHQQTIVSIICAYLRMPYTPPADTDPADGQRQAARRYYARRAETLHAPAAPPALDPREELQVRLTAQRILHTHLQPDAASHWEHITLDLTGATLIDFTLTGCHLHTATFTKAHFNGDVGFAKAKVGGNVWFDEAEVDGDVWFAGAKVGGNVWFDEAKVDGQVRFDGVEAGGDVWFAGAKVGGNVQLGKAKVDGQVRFDGARVGGDVWFGKAEVCGVWFDEAEVGGDVWFGKAEVDGNVWFGGAKVDGQVRFDGARVGGDVWFGEVRVGGDVRFDEADIGGDVSFDEVKIGGVVWSDGAKVGGDVRSARAMVGGNVGFGRAKVGGDLGFAGAKVDGDARFDTVKAGGKVLLKNMAVTGVLALEGLEVADRSQSHELPSGWRIAPGEGTAGRLVPGAAPDV